MTRTEIEKKVESNVNGLVAHIRASSSKCQTEEAAKHALVLPFLQFVLGWDIFNPLEVIPEFTADTGIKRGEKVDYAVMKKGKIAFIIECKMPGAKLESTHASQLYRYFGTLLPCRIAILTDGVRYLFYTDTENPNVLDSAPFFTVDFTKPETIMIEELSQFTRETFDVDDVTRTATQLMHTENIKAYLVRQLDSPSDEFVRLLINASDANAKFTAKNADIMRSIVKKALENVVQNRVHQTLKTAQLAGLQNGTASENGQSVGGGKEIVTTVEEWEGFYTVRTLLHDIITPDRVQFKDTVSYFNVLLDGNPRQQICRFYFNNPRKFLGLFSEKGEVKKEIGGIADLYLHKRDFAAAVQMYVKKTIYPMQAI
ncbi:MAG: type I restriction enzyme HsdR N-terminal domain-containing protein [Ignavibacteria bacterium]|nr:type I restriction enzyme HsdR N-terminal domain-containing protein [Ignavibacteria bacterium]